MFCPLHLVWQVPAHSQQGLCVTKIDSERKLYQTSAWSLFLGSISAFLLREDCTACADYASFCRFGGFSLFAMLVKVNHVLIFVDTFFARWATWLWIWSSHVLDDHLPYFLMVASVSPVSFITMAPPPRREWTQRGQYQFHFYGGRVPLHCFILQRAFRLRRECSRCQHRSYMQI